MRERNHKLWTNAAMVVIVTLLAGVLAWLALREDYWLDEGHSVSRVKAAWRQLYYPYAIRAAPPADPFDRTDLHDFNPPLYFAIIRLLAGAEPGRLAMRSFSIVPLAAGLLLLALRARRESGATGQTIVALVGATIPATLYYGHEARPYAMGVGVACLALALGWLWRARPGRVFTVCALGAAAGALIHFAFAFWIIALFFMYAGLWLDARRRGGGLEARGALAGAAGLVVGSLCAVAAIVPQWGIISETRASNSMELYGRVVMNSLAVPFSQVGSRPVNPSAEVAVQFAVLLMLAWLLRKSPNPRGGLCAVWMWLAPIGLTMLARLVFGITYYERYVIFATPGWLLALAWMVREAQERGRLERRLAWGVIGLVLFTNAWWCAMNLGRPLRSVWRPAVETMRAQARAGDYYTIQPEALRHAYAANAVTAPAAKYFALAQGLPRDARRWWIAVETKFYPDAKADFDRQVWRTEKVVESDGVVLFQVTRIGGGEKP